MGDKDPEWLTIHDDLGGLYLECIKYSGSLALFLENCDYDETIIVFDVLAKIDRSTTRTEQELKILDDATVLSLTSDSIF